VHHLDEILRPRKRLRENAGHPNGRRVDLRKLMAFEADPRRYDELWIRASIPDRREAAIGLLVDLSGSMRGPKTRAALLGTVLVAETLTRLQVPYRIDGFQDVLIPLKEFHDDLGPAVRQRIAEMVQEVEGCRHGGNNNPRYNDDAPCLLEHAEKLADYPATDRILIAVSDGLPEGRRSSSSDLHTAIAQLAESGSGLRLIALGLGPDTEHVKSFYPEAQANVSLPKFAETIGTLIENVLIDG
jgi:nitric oxide reductase activation protein